eukprot:762890-Pleurochrysis_carterae.AAC.5
MSSATRTRRPVGSAPVLCGGGGRVARGRAFEGCDTTAEELAEESNTAPRCSKVRLARLCLPLSWQVQTCLYTGPSRPAGQFETIRCPVARQPTARRCHRLRKRQCRWGPLRSVLLMSLEGAFLLPTLLPAPPPGLLRVNAESVLALTPLTAAIQQG